MPMPEPVDNLERVADRLKELLGRPGRYQSQWMRQAQRVREGQLSEAAIARVLFKYLTVSGEASGDASMTSRQFKDLVRRALRGTTITKRTLDWFINAFNMDEADAIGLWEIFTGAGHNTTAMLGSLRPPPTAAAAFQKPKWQTLSLLDFHIVGRDGLPYQHRTVQVIKATEDNMAKYPFRFDTTTVSVEVITGGTASSIYRIDDDLYAVDIVLPKPLAQGETMSLEYVSNFRYVDAPTPTYRRAVTGRMGNVSIHVKFSPEKLPRAVWWSVWADIRDDSQVLTRERLVLAPDHTVNRYVDVIERAVVGFEWEW